MKLIRALFPYNRTSPLHWLTEDGAYVDTSTCPECKNDEFKRTGYFEFTFSR